MSINKVVVSGNLTRDPEIRASQNGTNILTFGMAVNDRRRNAQTGEWEEYANFVDCVMFGNRADYMHRTLHKGMRVVVDGRLSYSSWERDGQRRSKLEVVVNDIDFISPRQQQGGYAPQQGNYGAPQQTGGYANQSQAGYDNRQQGYASGPSYNAPAPTQPQVPPAQSQDYGAPRPQAQPVSAPVSAPAQPAPAPAAPTPAPSSPVVTAPPETDVYDSDIPF